jgi:hypothetical protein
MLADVAQIGSPKEGIADGMEQHIGVAVSQKTMGVLNTHTSNPQRKTLLETMNVISCPNAHHRIL